MNPIVETQGLSRRYGPVEALRGLDLEIAPGGLLALLGCNGAGKTTAVKLMAGLIRPTAGSCRVFGVPSPRLGPAEWRRIAYVSDDQQLYGEMTVAELLAFVRPLYPSWDSNLEKQLHAILVLPSGRRVAHLSRGERAKLALLVSLAYRPRFVILDEPLSGLDPLARHELLAALLEITDQDEWTVLFSTQDVDDVERIADRVGILDRGRLRLEEGLHELQARFRRIEATVSSVEGRRLPPGLLQVERQGSRLRFVHERFMDDVERDLRERLPGATIDVHPMSLREIFVAVALRNREGHDNA